MSINSEKSDSNGKRKLSGKELNGNDGCSAEKVTREETTAAGVLLFSGLTDYSRRNDGDLLKSDVIKWAPNRFKSLENVKIRDVSSFPASYFFLAISESYTVYSCGLNEKGQLGLNDRNTRRNPTLVSALKNYKILSVATGRQHGLFLTDTGIVFACGDNGSGQCGVGSKKDMIATPTKLNYQGPRITKIACGDSFSMIINENGDLFSFGLTEYGQLGHGSDNKEVAGKKEIFHCEYSPKQVTTFREQDADTGEITVFNQPKIVEVSCGLNHTCAIDEQQRIFSWGFGGYGRLGHNSTSDEYYPRLMKCWYRMTGRADGGVTKAHCGAQFTFVETIIPGCLYMFGQMKLNGNANMYPKYADETNGWQVDHMVCGMRGYTACVEGEVLSAQISPAYGMLALGDIVKSSTQPKCITTLKDVYCFRVGLGYMHACFIARCDTDEYKKAIAQFPQMSFDEKSEDASSAESSETKPSGKKGRPPGKAAASKKGSKK